MSLVTSLQAESPKGNANGSKTKSVFKRILLEAENNPLLIGAVLENLLSADDATRNMQIELERLLPTLLSSAIDYKSIPDSKKVMEVLLHLLLANLQMLSSGRSRLNEALENMVYAAKRLMGQEYWNN